MTSAQSLLNDWGLWKYGFMGEYTLEMYVAPGCPTCGDSATTDINVYRDGKMVAVIERPDFHALLNEMLSTRPV